MTSLSSEPQGSAESGTTVVWTAQPSDPENDPLSYRFLLNGAEVQPFSSEKTWSWNTADAKVGKNKIEVQVKDDKYSDEFVSQDADFTISAPNQKPTLISLSSDKPNGATAGDPIIWTARASDPENDTIYYRFRLKGPSTNGQWIIKRDWGIQDSWCWQTCQRDMGLRNRNNFIRVEVRDENDEDENHFDDFAESGSFRLASPIGQPIPFC